MNRVDSVVSGETLKGPRSALKSAASERLLFLDVLRCVAILLVLGNHPPFELLPSHWGYGFFAMWQQGGWIGVDLFFVLSGFLIGGLLFKEIARTGTLDCRRFLIRRAFKIWPVYFLFLAVNGVHRLLRFPGDFTERLNGVVSSFWPNLLHIQNYTGYWGSPFGHTWSLAVEEHFYLTLPVLLMFLLRRGPDALDRFLPKLILITTALCLGLRVATAIAFPVFNIWIHLTPTHLRIDSLAVGVFLAWLVQSDHVLPLKFRSPFVLIAGLACLIPAFLFPREHFAMHTFGYSLFWIGASLIVLWGWAHHAASNGEKDRGGNAVLKVMAYIGMFSYSIYLWHLPYSISLVHRLVGNLQTPYAYGLAMLVYSFTAILLGIVSYSLVEGPALNLRDRLFPRPVQSGTM
jgi:peptidoglycan/LPS O-acetylase OafA/YrhL